MPIYRIYSTKIYYRFYSTVDMNLFSISVRVLVPECIGLTICEPELSL